MGVFNRDMKDQGCLFYQLKNILSPVYTENQKIAKGAITFSFDCIIYNLYFFFLPSDSRI